MVSTLDSGLSGLSSSHDRGTALCSWARHFTLIVPLSNQVYKWVTENLLLGLPCDGLASHAGGSRNTPSSFCLMCHLARTQTYDAV